MKRKNLNTDYNTTTEDESSFDLRLSAKRFKPRIIACNTASITRTSNGSILGQQAAAEIVLASEVVKRPGVSISP